jgi:hypothetical protein
MRGGAGERVAVSEVMEKRKGHGAPCAYTTTEEGDPAGSPLQMALVRKKGAHSIDT